MLIASDDLFYATPLLERMAHLRAQAETLIRPGEQNNVRFLLLHNNRNLFLRQESTHVPAFLTLDYINGYLSENPWAYLGRHDETDLIALDLSTYAETAVLSQLDGDYIFEDLRRAGPIGERNLAAQCAYARALMFWHARHQFCGACGSQTVMKQGGHVRQCQNPACGLEHFPRTDPAVIMLVHDGERCLLGHHSRMKEGMYSTLAGFVEPGETLEQAVRREVQEETSVKVGAVRYAGSQPWPFPTSLMIGYYASAESYEIDLSDDELSDARWFSRDDIRNFDRLGLFLPSRDSIARNLIETWLKAG